MRCTLSDNFHPKSCQAGIPEEARQIPFRELAGVWLRKHVVAHTVRATPHSGSPLRSHR